MAERPVECSQCKKNIKVVYKEMVSKTVSQTEMCADCPILLRKLHGTTPNISQENHGETEAAVCCGRCHTTPESVKMGNPVGCSECYTVFSDLLFSELIEENKLPKPLQSARRNQPLHVGKTPDKPVNIPASNRLTSLNEALNEALKKENYEEAAWLRDQIKELMEKKDDPAKS